MPPKGWTKPDPGYAGAHCRVRRERGKASSLSCEFCGDPAKEWAYSGLDPNELVSGEGRPYGLDPYWYLALCLVCHKTLDAPNSCIHGHTFTEENTYFCTKGWRSCKICRKVATDKGNAKKKNPQPQMRPT